MGGLGAVVGCSSEGIRPHVKVVLVGVLLRCESTFRVATVPLEMKKSALWGGATEGNVAPDVRVGKRDPVAGRQ